MALSPMVRHPRKQAMGSRGQKLGNVPTGRRIGLSTNQHSSLEHGVSSMAGFWCYGGADQTVEFGCGDAQANERLHGHGKEVVSVALSIDGQMLVSGEAARTNRDFV